MRTRCLFEAVGKTRRRHMNRETCATLLLGLAGLFAASSAQSIEIAVVDAQYSTDLSIVWSNQCCGSPGITREWIETTTSSTPISSELDVTRLIYLTDIFPAFPELSAQASADTFSVSTETAHRTADGGRAWATAETMLTFNTLQSGVAPLAFEFAGWGPFVLFRRFREPIRPDLQ